MKNILSILLIVFTTILSKAQSWPLEPATDHYKSLKQLNDKPSSARSWMDTIKYPPSEYSNSIVYTLVKPYYLTESQVKSLSESVNFPANSSDQTRKELDYMLELQSKRTQDQVKRVEFLANIGYWPTADILKDHIQHQQNLKDLFFEGREVLGDQITAGNFPKVAVLLKGVMRDMRIMEFTIKYKLLRVRPYHLEPNLHSLTKINSPSFASGHTLWAFVQAFTWSEIIPEKRDGFIALAEEIRRSREIMGIHFPSDNEAARQVAYKMIQYYFQNDSFRKDLEAAKKEWSEKKSLVTK